MGSSILTSHENSIAGLAAASKHHSGLSDILWNTPISGSALKDVTTTHTSLSHAANKTILDDAEGDGNYIYDWEKVTHAPWLVPRAPATLTWDTAKLEGEYFLCLLYASATTVTQSKWTDYADLAKYGWTVTTKQVDVSAGNPIPMGAIYTALGLDSSDTYNTKFSARQNRPATVGSTTYRLTDADYTNIMTTGPQSGAILADFNYGPDVEGKNQRPPVTGSGVVPLKQLSDIWFLMWQHYQVTATKMKNLNFIFRLKINNVNTDAIVQQAMKGATITTWPGTDFTMDQDEGKALLATPHGAGVSWLLIQHKEQLGRKVVKKITVFVHAPDRRTSLCFWLEDWAEGDVAP